ncbi:hypothetical protein [Kineococcus sp. SYSU DK003]|uniref:hypothetical protein n=1 Tax=Kineococcus sp. SYSU DK003 TaxID=3383124 RepID=UPI003D7CDF52
MPFRFRRTRRLGRGFDAHLSERGASVSKRFGRLTVSSNGRVHVRLFKGFSWGKKLW